MQSSALSLYLRRRKWIFGNSALARRLGEAIFVDLRLKGSTVSCRLMLVKGIISCVMGHVRVHVLDEMQIPSRKDGKRSLTQQRTRSVHQQPERSMCPCQMLRSRPPTRPLTSSTALFANAQLNTKSPSTRSTVHQTHLPSQAFSPSRGFRPQTMVLQKSAISSPFLEEYSQLTPPKVALLSHLSPKLGNKHQNFLSLPSQYLRQYEQPKPLDALIKRKL